MTFFYWTTNTAVRLAILYYFRRIFTTPKFRRLSMIVIVLCIIWCIPGFLADVFACIPMESIWNDKPGRCINIHNFSLVMTSTELLLDILVMVLPIREISNLQMSIGRKISVSFVFLLGSL